MNIYINGQPHSLAKFTQQTLQQALDHFLQDNPNSSTYAVALNSDFIAKEHYPTTELNANDKIDVLFPIQGG